VLASASVERGRTQFAETGCPACHGTAGRGDGAAAGALKDVWGHADPPRDLTAPWTFRGGTESQAVAARIAYGMSGTPMPPYADQLAAQQLADLVAYLRSIARAQP
jgi:mono/diheme cytochrome c family protein